MMNTNVLLIYYLLGINAVTFALYGIDKLKSKKGWWRVPEKTLLMLAVIGGSMGLCVECDCSTTRQSIRSFILVCQFYWLYRLL